MVRRYHENMPISKRQIEGKNMRAIFEGFISVDKNAVFSIQYKYGKKIMEVADCVNVDLYVIGQEYDICESILKNA